MESAPNPMRGREVPYNEMLKQIRQHGIELAGRQAGLARLSYTSGDDGGALAAFHSYEDAEKAVRVLKKYTLMLNLK